MSNETGGPAFPSHGSMGEVVCEGMTLRDYAVIKFIAAQISCYGIQGITEDTRPRVIAMANQWASAMIEARK